MTPPRILTAAVLTASLGLVPAVASAAPVKFTPGAAGAGDPYFPKMGNGGYDVGHYGITLAFDPGTGTIAATTRITARATKNLSRFNLDLHGLTVTALTVNGRPAAYRRTGFQELVITPRKGVVRGTRFTVAVSYEGVPKPVEDPALGRSGWITTSDGAVALNQPFGASGWFPVNDTPRDKAAYDFALTVPDGLQALANGDFLGRRAKAGKSTYRWRMRSPMASELSLVAIGKYKILRKKGSRGVPANLTAIDSALVKSPGQLASYGKRTAQIVTWESKLFGTYPFTTTGGILDNIKVGYSLETQGLPVHDWNLPGANPSAGLMVHELAHQWFGDSVTPAKWRDIWLNEGFATYAEWLWAERAGGATAAKQFKLAYSAGAKAQVWQGVLANPGRDHIFDSLVYQRGAMTLQVLRKKLGDDRFFGLLRAWATHNKGKNVTTKQFHAFAEKYSGKQLDSLFKKWVYTAGKPKL
ncbi:MAG: M1 family metallopeptidase [Streptosporangiaceae bacterium]